MLRSLLRRTDNAPSTAIQNHGGRRPLQCHKKLNSLPLESMSYLGCGGWVLGPRSGFVIVQVVEEGGAQSLSPIDR